MYFIEYNLLQEVQPDIMGRGAFAEPGIVVVAAKELDVMVALVEVESQIAAALRAFQIATKGAGLLHYGRPPAPGGLQALHLFPSHTVNHPKPGIIRVFHVAIGRLRKRNSGVALHLVDDPTLLEGVSGVIYCRRA